MVVEYIYRLLVEDGALRNSLHDEGAVSLGIREDGFNDDLKATYAEQEPLEIGRHSEQRVLVDVQDFLLTTLGLRVVAETNCTVVASRRDAAFDGPTQANNASNSSGASRFLDASGQPPTTNFAQLLTCSWLIKCSSSMRCVSALASDVIGGPWFRVV